MSDIDKRLEELAGNPNPLKDDIAALAAALLRARKALRLIAKEVEMLDYSGAAKEALADPELEESLLGARAP